MNLCSYFFRQSLYQIWSLEYIFHLHWIIIRDLIEFIPERSSGFSYFSQFKPEFYNNAFMIRAIISSRFCFHLLCRASSFFVAKNVSSLIWYWSSSDVHVWNFLLCCLERVFAMTSMISWQSCVSFCSASLCNPRSKLPVFLGISWFLLLYPIPYHEKDSFFFFFWSFSSRYYRSS